MWVARLSLWVAGWAWYPVPAPSPASPPKRHARARSVRGAWMERWGRGRGRIGRRTASFSPLSLGAAPKKKGTGGRGGGGGPISSLSPLPPTRSHPRHRPKCSKGRWLGWEREGGRGSARGKSSINIRDQVL